MNSDPAREVAASLIYEESLRLRERQEQRVDDMRRRSASALSVVTGAMAVAAGLGIDELPIWGVIASVALIGAAMAATLKVQFVFGDYTEGPDIGQLCSTQYRQAHPAHQVRRDLASYHWDHYNDNEDGPVASMQRWYRAQLVLIVAAVVVLFVAAAV